MKNAIGSCIICQSSREEERGVYDPYDWYMCCPVCGYWEAQNYSPIHSGVWFFEFRSPSPYYERSSMDLRTLRELHLLWKENKFLTKEDWFNVKNSLEELGLVYNLHIPWLP